MGNDVCSWDDFSIYAAPDKLSSSDKELESFNVGNQGKPSGFYGVEESGETGAVDSFPCYGFYGDESMVATGFGLLKQDPQQQQQQQNFKDCGLLDGVSFNAQSPLIPTCFNEIAELGQIDYGICEDIDEAKKGKQQPLCLSSLGLLNNNGNGFKRFHGERRTHDDITVSDARDDGDRKFSTEEIMRIAGEMFVKSCGQTVDGISMIQHPFNAPFSGLSDRETRDAELAVLLLAAAEKIGYQQYESASRLLKQCDYMSSKTGNPIQRVVYYFSEALREKIERSSSKGLKCVGFWQKSHIGCV